MLPFGTAEKVMVVSRFTDGADPFMFQYGLKESPKSRVFLPARCPSGSARADNALPPLAVCTTAIPLVRGTTVFVPRVSFDPSRTPSDAFLARLARVVKVPEEFTSVSLSEGALFPV